MRNSPTRIWENGFSLEYERANYGRGLAGFMLRQSHRIAEQAFGQKDHFDRVLEVGAGSGVHSAFVRHSFQEYWVTDTSPDFVGMLSHKHSADTRFHVTTEDASQLSFPDESFDRLIATHVLEHLYRPHDVLREWHRVVRPGGIMTIILPCDPGLLWRLGRHLGPRRSAVARGMPYDYVMAREHVNPIGNLVSFVRFYFEKRREIWWPLGFRSVDLNLFYVVHIVR